MLQGIKNRDIRRFKKTAEQLAKIMEEIQKYNPEAYIFCNMDVLELHGKRYGSDREFHFADSVEEVYIKGTDCGER